MADCLPMEPSEVVRQLWRRVQARDWVGMGELLADDVTVEWPVTAERVLGRHNVVSLTAEYGADRSVDLLRLAAQGDTVAVEAEVRQSGLLTRCTSFYTVVGDRVTTAREYWTTVGEQTPPPWHSAYTEPW